MTVLEMLQVRWPEYEAYCQNCNHVWPCDITPDDFRTLQDRLRWSCPDCNHTHHIKHNDLNVRYRKRWVVQHGGIIRQ